MSDDHATFTQQVRALVAENDRVPEQRTGDEVVPDWTACDGDPCRTCRELARDDVPTEFMVKTLEAAAEEIVDRWPSAAAYLQGRARGIANRSVGGE